MKGSIHASDLFISLSLLNTSAVKRMDMQLSVHGISFTEYLILRVLSEAIGHTKPRIELARSIGLSASGVTRLLAPMEKLGLVEKEKNPRDARMSLVRLSNAGRTIFEETSVTFEEGANDVFRPLTDNQLATMADLTARLS